MSREYKKSFKQKEDYTRESIVLLVLVSCGASVRLIDLVGRDIKGNALLGFAIPPCKGGINGTA